MIQLLTPTHWKDYELIDCGDFERLERFGEVILIFVMLYYAAELFA
jgi:23S rRNA (cytosine1962-C5)-methyltransferase